MKYDRAATISRIYEAAAVEFAKNGISGARIDTIAAEAKASKALIYTYFGNKEELFAQVITEKLTALAESVMIDPMNVSKYFTDVFDYLVSHPDIMRFMQHEATHYPPTTVPAYTVRQERYLHRVEAIKQAQQLGTVDRGLDAEAAFLSLMGMVNWFFTAPQITSMMLGDVGNPAVQFRFRNHLADMVQRVLGPPGGLPQSE